MSGSINAILSNAASGLSASQGAITVLSDNVANAGVANYTTKQLTVSTFEAGGQTSGVRTGAITRSVDAAVQASVWASASTVGALTVRSQVLNAVNQTQGTPGDGTSIADGVTALQSAFTQLQSQPSDPTEQSTVVQAAATLANTINSTAATITSERNSVQSQIVSSVATLNSAMTTVDETTKAIMTATSAGGDTSGLEDQRDTALQTVASMLNVTFSKQANGNITVLGQSGLSIPLDSQFSTQSAVLLPGATTAAGTVPAIMMDSSSPTIPAVNVTARLGGGQLGELVQQRDTTLPAYTASLDALSAKLSNQFTAQGLQLFTDGTGATTLTAYAGLSSQITVNPTVSATPSLVRDGTAGANSVGAAGYTGVIDNVLSNTFTASGTTTSIGADAQSFVSKQSAATSQATTDLTSATSYQTVISSQFSSGSGVNVDNQMGLMIQLQNSYQANARVIQASESMFATLVAATLTSGA